MKGIITTVIAVFISMVASAQADPYAAYEKKEFVPEEGTVLPYRILRPEMQKPGKKYPLVIFLHGAGERGKDNTLQLFHGGQLWLNPVNREKYPAFVLAPQCPEGMVWTELSRYKPKEGQPSRALTAELKALIDEWIADPAVDPKRVYIFGLSMGGIATFDLCITYPELFAAALPICGNTDVTLLEAAKDISFRIFHGDRDEVVPFEGSRAAYRTLKALGAKVEYIEYPGVGHNSWDYALKEKDFLEWMFKQKKR